MKVFIKSIVYSFLATLLLTANVYAQFPPREEDHFWRRTVIKNIDLAEKMNKALVGIDPELSVKNKTDYRNFGEGQGIVTALLNGVKSGKFLARDADSCKSTLTWDDVKKKAQHQNDMGGDDNGSGGDGTGTDGDGLDGDGFDDGFEFDDDDFGFGDDDFGDDDGGGDGGGSTGNTTGTGTPAIKKYGFETANYETYIQITEDWIFDKVRSDMYYDIRYIRLFWYDINESGLPEEAFICFDYKEVMDGLDDVMWINKFNDAEHKSMREILELRMYNAYVISISGKDMASLLHSDLKENKMVEYEHNLWEY